jgi:lysophospholipase L1-like esterase
MFRTLFLSLFLYNCLSHSASAQGRFYLRDGDTVVFYGDSITNQRLYTNDVEIYACTRFPNLNVRFVHSGWGGDRVTGGSGGPVDTRLQRDVEAYRPTVVTVLLGMNDGGYRPFDEGLFKIFAEGYDHIVKRLRASTPGLRLTVMEPSPYDDVTQPVKFEGGYNAVLQRYGRFVRELAAREKIPAADLNTPVVAALIAADLANKETARSLIPDRVHPSAGVHLLMAEALLKTWNAPSVVSAVEIDASTGKVAAKNTSITELDQSSGLRWTQTDRALPMPLDRSDETVALALQVSDFVAALDQQPLQVKQLPEGSYRLRIDGETAGTFSAEQLETGVNLALLDTPMLKQAAKVAELSYRHNNLHFARWRMLEQALSGYGLGTLEPAIQALDALEAETVALQRTTAQPAPHRFELTRQ